MKKYLRLMLVLFFLITSSCAKDYAFRAGPYGINFSLPDKDILVTNNWVQFDQYQSTKTTTGGLPYTIYRIAMHNSTGPSAFEFSINHYSTPGKANLTRLAKMAEQEIMKRSYVACEDQPALIDGHNGTLITGLAGWGESNIYRFAYQPDNSTLVTGISYLGKELEETFLKSLHIEYAAN